MPDRAAEALEHEPRQEAAVGRARPRGARGLGEAVGEAPVVEVGALGLLALGRQELGHDARADDVDAHF